MFFSIRKYVWKYNFSRCICYFEIDLIEHDKYVFLQKLNKYIRVSVIIMSETAATENVVVEKKEEEAERIHFQKVKCSACLLYYNNFKLTSSLF